MTMFTPKQLCEFDVRDFLGEEDWKKWKMAYDDAMAFRKTLKGKPTDEQRLQLQMNAEWIDFCDRVLWHSARQASHGRCVCKTCNERRKAKA